ncbi:MAG TPA: ATP-binding protein [Anaerolineae bacterium]|nr:ATP-binding protein [Anaerolineae bacterium]HQI86876.1 ATP-binding protein [Anaerolineae bacterium]
MFINREQELAWFEERYWSSKAEFIVLTGRRRVGKTALLAEFATAKPGVYFLAYLDSAEMLLRNLSASLWEAEHGAGAVTGSYGSWLGLFQAVGRLAAERRFVLILDEYPYLADAGERLASVIQKLWDETLQYSHVFLVLCGSYMSVMERDVLNRDAPLYGRRTAQLTLRPLTPGQMRDFLPGRSPVELIEAYALTGGMPAYLAELHPERSLWTNLSHTAFDPANILYHDGLTLLRDEMRDPRHYAAVLRAIANGYHTLSAIAQEAGVERSSLTAYLSTLQGAGYVERRVPVGIAPTAQRQRGTWHIADPYIRFWGRYILPYTGAIEKGQGAGLVEQVLRPTWEQFVAIAWEDVVRAAVYDLTARATPGFWPEVVGSWWDVGHQIDLAAVSYQQRVAWLGEAKWRNEPMNLQDLDNLQRRARAWQGNATGWRLYYPLFSRSGFTAPLRERAAGDPDVLLFTPEDVVS